MVGYKEVKRGDHGKPGTEYTAVMGFKNEQLAFVQRGDKRKWRAFLDIPLSPTNYIWQLGEFSTRKKAEDGMLNVVQQCKETGRIQEFHLVVGLWEAVIDEAEAFSTAEKADEFEKALCKSYELPFDREERNRYYDTHEVKGEVYSYVLKVDELKIDEWIRKSS